MAHRKEASECDYLFGLPTYLPKRFIESNRELVERNQFRSVRRNQQWIHVVNKEET